MVEREKWCAWERWRKRKVAGEGGGGKLWWPGSMDAKSRLVIFMAPLVACSFCLFVFLLHVRHDHSLGSPFVAVLIFLNILLWFVVLLNKVQTKFIILYI
jgi:hypothetical protein